MIYYDIMMIPCLRLYYFNFKDMNARRCKFDDQCV